MPDASGMGMDWDLERYRPGDERDMLELFRLVFGKQRSLEHWTWQFNKSPYGGPFATLARRKSDHLLVGQHVVMLYLLNVKGRPVRGCHSLDLAVHPDYRGQRIFDVTARDCFEWCLSHDIQFVVAFPNASSYPGFVRTLGWNRILFPNRYVMRVGIGGAVRKGLKGMPLVAPAADLVFRSGRRLQLSARHLALTRQAGRGVRFVTSATVPEGHEALWNACRSQEVLSLWKDSQYLRWRYDDNPQHEFSYLYATIDGVIAALAVIAEFDAVTTICELLVREHDVQLGRLLLSHACLRALDRGAEKVSFLGYDGGFFHEVFEGFERNVSFENVFVGRAFQDAELNAIASIPSNWTVTFGDADFV
jgi:GNAT superfamily N-acetyltransferase